MERTELVAAIRERARVLYEGKQVAHRSCGVALAEAFGREPAAYRSLRRGGITGAGLCGAVLGGQLVLGEIFGDPDPAGPVTPALREAMVRFEAEVARRVAPGPGGSRSCNDLVSPFPVFLSPERAGFCTALSADVAEIVAAIVLDLGGALEVGPLPPR